MSSRAVQKSRLKAQRQLAERRETQRARRRRLVRLWAFAGVVALAVGVLAALGLAGHRTGSPADKVDGVADGAAMLAGLPQDGSVLGTPSAKVALTEFADLQCPYCREYALTVLPQIIETYVRPGRLKLDLRLLRFIGPDSDRGAQAALAAGAQDRMWQFVDLWYRNQGTENTGYGDEAFVERLAAATGVTGTATGVHEAQLHRAEQEASAAGIDSTPSFVLDGERFSPDTVSFDAFRVAIDAALKR